MNLKFLMRSALVAAAVGVFCATPQQASAELLTGLTDTTGGSNRLIRFDSAAPGTILSNVAVTGLVAGDSLVGIDVRPATGGLYGLSLGSRLYLINPVTGAATQVGSDGAFTLNGTQFGFDFNPTVDRIRVTTNADQNLRLNPNDGSVAGTDGTLAYAAGDPNFGANPNITGSAYTNNVNGATTTTLYNIDSNLNVLVTQNPPNNGALNTVGSLGRDVPDIAGFDISSQSGVAYAAFINLSNGLNQLFTVNLTTGATTIVGNIGNGSINLVGLAVTVPEPGSLALAGFGVVGVFGGWLVRRRRAR